MDADDFNSLMRGMREVADYEAGAREGFVTYVPASVDVRAIRKGMRQTQAGFANTYGFSVGVGHAIGNKAAANPNAPPASFWP